MDDEQPGGGRALILMTVVAAPIALGFETLLREVFFPPEFEEVRALFGPVMTVAAWVLVALTVVLSVVGLALQRRLVARAVARIPPGRRDAGTVHRAELGAFLLSASVPQVPAILASLAFMWGSSLTPTVAAISIATVGIVAQALSARGASPRERR